ncbi:MAG: hypothetical protein ACKOC5_05450 [Chloroflexota bacterium]
MKHSKTQLPRGPLLSGLLISVLLLAACSPAGAPTAAPSQPAQPTLESYPAPGAYPAAPGAYPAGQAYPPAEPAAQPYPASPYPSAGPDSPVSAPASPDPQNQPAPAPEPWLPRPEDAALERGEAFTDEAQVLTLESMPPQFVLQLAGNVPTPCHQLRAQVDPPDARRQINVSVYTVVNPNMICTQVLAPFSARVPLTGLQTGAYSVLVNGQPAGQVMVP